MTQYIDKDALVAEIEKRIKEIDVFGTYLSPKGVLTNLLCHLDTLEVKEVEEKAVNNDLEDYAKKESESFAEREYEIDYIDRNALAKGYYWGVKAGVQWQKQKNAIEVKEVDLDFQRFAKEMEIVFALPFPKTKNTEGEPLSWEYAIAKHFYSLGIKAQKGGEE